MTSIILVSLLPLALLAPNLYDLAWDNARREVVEKHLLLAQNLAEPLRMYVDSHKQSLQILASTMNQLNYADLTQYQPLVSNSVEYLHGFSAISLVTKQGQLRAHAIKPQIKDKANIPDYTPHPCYKNTINNLKWDISAVHRSFISSEPTIVMSQPVFDAEQQLTAVLIAEMDLAPIEAIRNKVHFGERGHSAFVDNKGRVLAHPNPQWAAEIKDLSSWPIVDKMTKGHLGVAEFYSDFIKADMIAGYAGIKELGWGVMVPQPKMEIEAQVQSILMSLLMWSIVGITGATLAAFLLARWISRPINKLAAEALQLHDKEQGSIGSIPANAPHEVHQLAFSLKILFDSLKQSNQEIRHLNDSLQQQINHATAELRIANKRLQKQASSDHLTTIGNRRYFEDTLSDILSNQNQKTIGIMLIDIDNFKAINDTYGHAAGDYVLTTVAKLLIKSIRPGDVVARYGGDEFVAQMQCDIKILQNRAEDLRARVESYGFKWHNEPIQVTLSIGILCHQLDEDTDINSLMSEADMAMYQSKQAGRNRVSTAKGTLLSDA